MAKFPALTFTEKGIQMLVQAQNAHKLTFTCGKLGSGALVDSDDISKFVDLKAPKMTLPITKVDDSNPEKIVLTFDTSNTSLEEGFVSREIGIFAKLDNGSETLYAYSNAGSNYDYIPSKDTPSDENRLVVNLVVISSANISVQIDKSIVYTHKSDVEEMIAAHDASDTAHENRFKLFEKISDFADDIIKKLALTTAISAITALETNSWFGQLLKMVLNASGVKYNIAPNGYVCLGSFFGGLIIQWIIAKEPMVNWPIAFTQCYGAIPVSYGTIGNKSAQKSEYGMRGSIAFDEIGIDSWYVRTSNGSISYAGYVGYFGIGIYYTRT